MRTTDRRPPRLDFLHPAGALTFVVLAVVWILVASGGDWQSPEFRAAARLAGYVGFIAMLIPYIHIVRRCFRSRRGLAMTTWLRWHIGAAYLAFAMVLIHSRGRSNGPVTLGLLWLTWIVMISGIVGYYGQKLLYAWMPRLVPHEYGLERLGPECDQKLAEARALIAKKEMVGAAGIVAEFCQSALTQCLERPLRFSMTLRATDEMRSLLSENGWQRAKSFADAKQQPLLDELWSLVVARRHMDLEYRLHQLGRLWLYVHGPAAWALLVVMIDHVVMSWRYGGF
ncbi:MAG: hypothetical protein WCL32_18745 [Planctomycetota bacterium]|jgi:hypothetical protein